MWVGHTVGAASAVVSGGGFPRQTFHDRLRRGRAVGFPPYGAEVFTPDPYIHLASAWRPCVRIARIALHHVVARGAGCGDHPCVPRGCRAVEVVDGFLQPPKLV